MEHQFTKQYFLLETKRFWELLDGDDDIDHLRCAMKAIIYLYFNSPSGVESVEALELVTDKYDRKMMKLRKAINNLG